MRRKKRTWQKREAGRTNEWAPKLFLSSLIQVTLSLSCFSNPCENG